MQRESKKKKSHRETSTKYLAVKPLGKTLFTRDRYRCKYNTADVLNVKGGTEESTHI
jgi:hypothetical protein